MVKRHFFVWLLPLLWGANALLHFKHPGDEYMLYAVSSFPGSWIAFLVNFGEMENIMLPVALTGSVVMAAVGFIMDRLRPSVLLWFVVFMVVMSAAVALTVRGYPSIGRALSKNGSWFAYFCAGANAGMYAACLLASAQGGLRILLHRYLPEPEETDGDEAEEEA